MASLETVLHSSEELIGSIESWDSVPDIMSEKQTRSGS